MEKLKRNLFFQPKHVPAHRRPAMNGERLPKLPPHSCLPGKKNRELALETEVSDPAPEATTRKTIVAAGNFMVVVQKFIAETRQFIVTAGKFIADRRKIIVDAKKFIVEGGKFMVSALEFIVNTRKFIVSVPTFLVGHRISWSKPRYSLFRPKIAFSRVGWASRPPVRASRLNELPPTDRKITTQDASRGRQDAYPTREFFPAPILFLKNSPSKKQKPH